MNAIAPDPLAREAFVEAQLARAIATARAALYAARALSTTTGGKAARLTARRTVRAASTALNRAEAALAAEQRAELHAPHVQRVDHMQGGVMLREACVSVASGGRLMATSPLDRLHQRGTLSTAQRMAGGRYRSAWEAAGVGAFPCGLGGGAGGRSVPGSGNVRIERAAGSSLELDRLRGVLGTRGTSLVEHVVVHELSVDGWAARGRLNAQVAMGMLIMALDLLAEHCRREGR